ncbi:SDR family NAD(P)-dependent oxidoreductase, partial [Limosilactobacillus fermentum]
MIKRLKQLRFLRNKVVLITGGSEGIGKALALEAARRGAVVVVAARNQEKLQEVADRCLILAGRPSFAFKMDVTDP